MNKKDSDSFYHNNSPIKITEGRKLKLHSECWSILTEYYLESVKITNYKGAISSTATLRVGDRSGQVTCIIKGPLIGLLFGLSPEEWNEVERMCNGRDQLFYRYFKNGVNSSFGVEQKMFYNFCMTNQKHDVLVVKFRRCINTRNKFKSDPLLELLEVNKCNYTLLDLYIEQLRLNSSGIA